MIRVKGTQVAFILLDDREVAMPAVSGMLHDPDGVDWPKCSLLFGPYTKTRKRVEQESVDREYYGKDAPTFRGSAALPPLDIAKWKRVRPDVARVYYLRNGRRYPLQFTHKFSMKRWWGAKTPAILYRHGRFYRLDFPAGCDLSWRGIVKP